MTTYFSYDELGYITSSRDEALESYPYIKTNDRPDPFNPSVLEFQIVNHSYSQFMRDKITNINIACDHASYQCRQWMNEDKAVKLEARRASNRLYQQRFREKQKEVKLQDHNITDLNAEYRWSQTEKRRIYNSIYMTKQGDPELEKFRQAWRSALAQRTELMNQWDKYVNQCRKAYLLARMQNNKAQTNVVIGEQNGN